jgi:hypothetical protein
VATEIQPTTVTETLTLQRGASIICVLLAMMVMSFLLMRASRTEAAATQSLTPTTLSGPYAFSGSLGNIPGQYESISGSLNLDWLGDISGQGWARRIGRGVSSEASCRILMEGTYKPTKDPLVMAGTITLIPIYGDCGGELGKQHSWMISIEPGAKSGALDLSQILASGPWFIGIATSQTAKLS